MPFWRRKSSPKEVKTNGKKHTLIDTIHEKFKNHSKNKGSLKSERVSGTISERSFVVSRSALPSTQVSRSHSFADSGVNSSEEKGLVGCCHPLTLSSLSRHASNRTKHLYGEGELATTASVSTDSTLSTDDVTDSQLISPQASDYESATRTAINSPSSMEKEQPKLLSIQLSEPIQPSPPKPRQRPKRAANVQNLQIPSYADFFSAPTSMKTSPSRSAVPTLRNYPVQPKRLDNGRQEHHRLPVPPLSFSVSLPFSPSSVSPSIYRSPGQVESSAVFTQKWKKGRLIGRGTFGEVYLGFNSETGEMCAMKEVTVFPDDAKSKECAEQICQEILLLSSLRHPNIVQYYGSESVDDKLYIYLEYVSGGSIHKLLQEYGQLGEAVIRSYTLQILSGLAYLHAKNTVHRDIKGANILVDPSGRVKLADFGMAKHISGQPSPLSFKGSPHWMAPELIKNSNGNNLAVDIWSLGCTVLEMATAKPPWSQYEGIPALFKIGNSKELPAIPDHLSEEGKDFVRQCLQRDPHHRPCAAELLEHPFVNTIFQLERPLHSFGVARPTAFENITSPSYLRPGVANYRHRSGMISPGSSDVHMPRINFSCPVSPIGSPLLRPTSSDCIISPPSNSASGYCTPNRNPNSLHIQHPVHETICFQRPENSLFLGGTQLHQDLNHEISCKSPLTSHVYLHSVSHGQTALADRVSQLLVKDCCNPRSMSSNQPLASLLLAQTKYRYHLNERYQ